MTRAFRIALVAAALALSSAAASAQQADASRRLLTVTGEGSVQAKPDMALISVGVVSEAESAGDALSANSRSMTDVLDSLKAEGLESRDLQTSGFGVEPVYSQQPRNWDQTKPFRPEIVGYRVRNNVNVRIRQLDRVGAILDKVVTLGANSVSGPSFTVDDPAPLQDEARREAVKDALHKAGLFADAAGTALGPIFSIQEGYTSAPQPQRAPAFRMVAADAASTPIEAGELNFEAQVTVSWTLAD